MKTEKPAEGSGKTRINRKKGSGESWTLIRDKERKRAKALEEGK